MSIVPDSLEGLEQHAAADTADNSHPILATVSEIDRNKIAKPEARFPCASPVSEHGLAPDSLAGISSPHHPASSARFLDQEAANNDISSDSSDRQSIRAMPSKKYCHPQGQSAFLVDPIHNHGGSVHERKSSPAAPLEQPTSENSASIKEESQDLGIDVAVDVGSSQVSSGSSLGKRRRSRHGEFWACRRG